MQTDDVVITQATSKYAEFLTADEREEMETIIGLQSYHRQRLRNFRKSYTRLFWLARDRARKQGVEA